MKPIRTVVMALVFVSMCGIVSARASVNNEDLRSILGVQYGMLEDVQQYANAGNYAAIYASLADDYTGVVDRDRFLRVCERLKWTVRAIEIGKVTIHMSIAYAPVRAVSIAGSREIKIDTVVFWIKSKDGWKMLNFPFLDPNLPDFGAIPESLR
ncbi:hypothetical protein GALL_280890 [mine drainage metagenome]|uniref:DUF4440 domain-containing protein n=1 Tax=mine drainage metagenome TaxID=410659 RepID=A0A1J5RDB4_9ZZZZ